MRPDGSDQHRLVALEGPLPDLPAEEWAVAWDEWGMSSADDHFQGSAAWSPDGGEIAFSGGDCGCIQMVDVASGELLEFLTGDFSDLSWDSEGMLGSQQQRVD
jgi:hypothetical protein